MKFALEKTELIYFTKRDTNDPGPSLSCGNVTVTPVEELRYLRVWLDPKLNWTKHLTQINQKSYQRLFHLHAVCKIFWGISRKTVRSFYVGAVRPVMEHSALAGWMSLKEDGTHFQRFKGKCSWWSPGGVFSTPRSLLKLKSSLIPMNTHLRKRAMETLIRIRSS